MDESLDSMEATSDEDKTEQVLYQHIYQGIFQKDDIPEFQDQGFSTILDDIPMDVDIVLEKLSNLNSGKATGPDGLPPRVLKETGSYKTC